MLDEILETKFAGIGEHVRINDVHINGRRKLSILVSVWLKRAAANLAVKTHMQ